MAAGWPMPDPIEFTKRVHKCILPPVSWETSKLSDLPTERFPDLADVSFPFSYSFVKYGKGVGLGRM
jgi:hypothetical protein